MLAEVLLAATIAGTTEFVQEQEYVFYPPGEAALEFDPFPPIGTVVEVWLEYSSEVVADAFVSNLTGDPVPFVVDHDGAVQLNDYEEVPRTSDYFEGVLLPGQSDVYIALGSGINRFLSLQGDAARAFAAAPDVTIAETGHFVTLPDDQVETVLEAELAFGIVRVEYFVEFGFADLLVLLGAWHDCPTFGGSCGVDIDGDDAIGLSDLLILLELWGGASVDP